MRSNETKGSHHMRFFNSRTLLVFVAVLAMSAVTASAASAVTPEFKPVPAKKKLTSTSGKVVLKWGANEATCTKSTATGEITGAKTVGKVVVKFTGCEIHGSGHCLLNSGGAEPGEIITKSLGGELGTVKTTEAASGVGLLLKPEVERQWATLEANSCTGETAVTGSVAGEVAVVGKKQATNKLAIKPAIKEIKLDSGTLADPVLTAWSTTVTMTSTDELTFEEALEVT